MLSICLQPPPRKASFRLSEVHVLPYTATESIHLYEQPWQVLEAKGYAAATQQSDAALACLSGCLRVL